MRAFKGYFFLFSVLLLGNLFFQGESFAQSNLLLSVKNTPKNDRQTLLKFELSKKPNFEISTNFKARVMIIKFRDTNLQDLASLLVFNDPIIAGLQFQKMGEGEYWAKIRTKQTNLRYRVVPSKTETNRLFIEFIRKKTKVKQTTGVELVEMLRELNPNSEKIILTLDKPTQISVFRDNTEAGSKMKIRLMGTKMTPDLIVPSSATKILKGITMEERGRYLLITLRPDKYIIHVSKKVIREPEFQIQLIVTPNKSQTVATQAKVMQQEKELEELQSKEELAREKFIIKKFEEAEYQFRRRAYEKAGLQFTNIYNFSPLTELGVRAKFRAADSYYRLERNKKENGDYNFVIQQYREAINAALTADLGYDDIPRAYFNIGKSHLKNDLFTSALTQFNLILQLYPESPFAKDALFESGVIHLELQRYQESIESLQNFIQENPSAPQVTAAHYKVGENQFQLKQYKEAKKSFDQAWSMDPKYMLRDPELMFHMGEAYFENQDYSTAREIYEQLLDNHPTESFSNLVAIRIGDFYREEDKVDDAINAYKKAIVRYTRELLLVGKMRIANLLAENPDKKSADKALATYDFILKEHPLSDQVEEAMLRKGLTLSLFHHFDPAIAQLEIFCGKYPENIYVKHGIIQERILETIQNYIRNYYDKEQYLDSLGVWEKYQKKYYTRLQTSTCYVPKKNAKHVERPNRLHRAPLFILADSYFRLGLHQKALESFQQLEKQPEDTLLPLVYYIQGQIYDLQENYDQAQAVYAKFIAKHPNHSFTPTVKKALGDSYSKVQKFDRVDRAIRIYQQTIRDYQDADNPLDREIIAPCWFALGNLYQGIGKYDDAIRSYKKVLSTYEHPLEDPKVIDIVIDTHFTIGKLFFELNQMPEAMAAYNEAIRLFPKSAKAPWAKYQKGQIYIKYNEKAKALKVFAELIEEAKSQPDALWGPLAVESHELLVNDLSFDTYLNRDAKAGSPK